MPRYVITNGEKTGYIDLTPDKLIYSLDKTFDTRPNYVQSVEKLAEIGLNKCHAKLTYYSLMAELRSIEFIISNHELNALKKTLGK